MENNIFITNREIINLETYSLAEELNERINEQYHKELEERLEKMLDNRPRYSKRIPTKLYMKFHTIDIIRGEVKSYKEPWIWYKIEQENKVRFKFRFPNF